MNLPLFKAGLPFSKTYPPTSTTSSPTCQIKIFEILTAKFVNNYRSYDWKFNIVTNSSNSLPQNSQIINISLVGWRSEYSSSMSMQVSSIIAGWTCVAAPAPPPLYLCEAGVGDKVVTQVREEMPALILVGVLGFFLIYASCPAATFLNCKQPFSPWPPSHIGGTGGHTTGSTCDNPQRPHAHTAGIQIVISLMISYWSELDNYSEIKNYTCLW